MNVQRRKISETIDHYFHITNGMMKPYLKKNETERFKNTMH